jgi:hypothetical protein
MSDTENEPSGEETVPLAEELGQMMAEMREIYHELSGGLVDLREQRKGLTAQWDNMARAFRTGWGGRREPTRTFGPPRCRQRYV